MLYFSMLLTFKVASTVDWAKVKRLLLTIFIILSENIFIL
jgi:hypothetical protein